jgi:hypothetical protein
MSRFTILAALAALNLTSVTALAAPVAEVRIPVAGKTSEQLHVEIKAAIRKVCRHAVEPSETFYLQAFGTCEKDTHEAAMKQLETLKSAQQDLTQFAVR